MRDLLGRRLTVGARPVSGVSVACQSILGMWLRWFEWIMLVGAAHPREGVPVQRGKGPLPTGGPFRYGRRCGSRPGPPSFGRSANAGPRTPTPRHSEGGRGSARVRSRPARGSSWGPTCNATPQSPRLAMMQFDIARGYVPHQRCSSVVVAARSVGSHSRHEN